MMVAGAALGAGLTALNASEKAKMDERLMVQRLRNQSILPRARPYPHPSRTSRHRVRAAPPAAACTPVMRVLSQADLERRVRTDDVQLRPAALALTTRAATMTIEHLSRVL